MNQWVVWFNFLAFTLMFAAFAFAFIDYLQDRRPWLRTYLLSFAAFAFWLLLATFRFFQAEFIPGDHTAPELAIGWMRVAVSMVMGFTAPLLVIQLKHGRASARQILLCALVPLVVAAGIAAYTASGILLVSVGLSLAFNGLQAGMAAWGIKVLRRAVPDPRAASLRGFFRLSVGLYLLAIAYVVFGQLVKSAVVPASNAFLNGLFGMAWSVLLIASHVSRTRARAGEGPTLLECKTYRFMGHSRFEPSSYRTKEELAAWKEKDPILRFRLVLRADMGVSEPEIVAVESAVDTALEEAVRFAEQSPDPAPGDWRRYIFAGEGT